MKGGRKKEQRRMEEGRNEEWEPETQIRRKDIKKNWTKLGRKWKLRKIEEKQERKNEIKEKE